MCSFCFIFHFCSFVYSLVTMSVTLVLLEHFFFFQFEAPYARVFLLVSFWRILLGGTVLPVVCSSAMNLVDRKTFANIHKARSMLCSLFLIVNTRIYIMCIYRLEIHIYFFHWWEFVFVWAYTSPFKADIQGRKRQRQGKREGGMEEREREDMESKWMK